MAFQVTATLDVFLKFDVGDIIFVLVQVYVCITTVAWLFFFYGTAFEEPLIKASDFFL